jgi:hypothetical protein
MLNEFKTNFSGGTRSNRFLIEGTFPTGGAFTKFHVRSTIMPQLSTKTLTLDYFGRKFHYPGEKEYGTWTFSVLDDQGGTQDLWQYFQNWQNSINNHQTNISSPIDQNTSYKAYGWRIKHLDMNGTSILKEYIMHGCWPTAINQMSLNMANPNMMNVFQVIVVYDYIELVSQGINITNTSLSNNQNVS